MSELDETYEHVEAAPHEFAANLIYDTYALRPFFGCNRAVKDGDGSVEAPFDGYGEEWTARLSYKDSGIVHPGDENPQGTEFRIQEIPEYELKVEAQDDPTGEKDFYVNLSPRWQGMEVENSKGQRSELSVPEGIHEAVNLSVKGSNIPFAHYPQLVKQAFAAVGVRGEYFETPHEFSNIRDAEMYVRIHKDDSGPIHARDGPLAQLGHLLENDRSGYRKIVQNDQDGRGRNLAGYYHTVTLGPERIRKAFDGHSLPREIKHYYSREAGGMDDENPLAHPKLGASYQVNRWNESLGVTDDDLEQLERELSETVLTILDEAGIDTHPLWSDDRRPFVPDAYFDADTRDYSESPLHNIPLAEIEQHQEQIVVKHLADGFSAVQWETLEQLVTDGGTVSPTDIADMNDRHVDSVRRALNEIPELVEHSYGEVALRNRHVADMVHNAVTTARDSVRRAVETGAKARMAAKRGTDKATSALMAYCANMGIEADDKSDARLELRMNKEGAQSRIRQLVHLWENSGRDPERIRSARITFENGSKGTLWHWL